MHRNTLALAGLLTLLAGCPEDGGTKDSAGDSGPTMPDPTECPTFYTGPVLVDLAQVSCTDTATVRFYVETTGWTSGGLWFSQETGNADTPYDQWSDEHDIGSFEFDECGNWDHLDQTLSTGAGTGDWAVNTSTVFSCEPNVHFDGSGVMTYAARVYDLDGNFADCLAFGHDVDGLKNGTYNRANEPDVPAEIGDCTAGVGTR